MTNALSQAYGFVIGMAQQLPRILDLPRYDCLKYYMLVVGWSRLVCRGFVPSPSQSHSSCVMGWYGGGGAERRVSGVILRASPMLLCTQNGCLG